MKPTVGRIVHYVSYGEPGGEYVGECRAAIVTRLHDDEADQLVGLCVLNPEGMFFDRAAPYADAGENEGGSWHWPERVEEQA